MIGPPIGVEPRKATDHSAMTRPRICGSEASCTVLEPCDRVAMLTAADEGDRDQFERQVRGHGRRGDADAEPDAGADQDRAPVLPRAATQRPPTIAPAPIAEVMKP